MLWHSNVYLLPLLLLIMEEEPKDLITHTKPFNTGSATTVPAPLSPRH
jgi:hypothetical protein